MRGPRCVVSQSLAIFVLFMVFPGMLEQKLHRCLHEFDPSNCNALEEVWAFDTDENECIEVVYGGCGKPKHLANRFETREECLLSCGHLLGVSVGTIQAAASAMDEKRSGGSAKSPLLIGLGRAASVGTRTASDLTGNLTVIENIRSVLNDLRRGTEQQPQLHVEQNPGQLPSPQAALQVSTFGGQTQPVYDQSQGRLVQAQLSRMQPVYGTGQGPYSGQQFGNVQGSLRFGQYGGQALGYGGQLQRYGVQALNGNFERLSRPSDEVPISGSYSAQQPLLTIPQAPLPYRGPQ